MKKVRVGGKKITVGSKKTRIGTALFKFTRKEKCFTCEGKKTMGGKPCPTCGGAGTLEGVRKAGRK